MKTPKEILIKNGVIRNLLINKEHFEYRSDDPEDIMNSIEEYGNQFKPQWITTSVRYPDLEVRVLIKYKACVVGAFLFEDRKSKKLYFQNDFDIIIDAVEVENWMPMPS